MFTLVFTDTAKKQLKKLKGSNTYQKQYNAVCKTLKYLADDPRHPGLQTHKFESLSLKAGLSVFEAYAENKTSSAFIIFFSYGPGEKEITVLSIIKHP